MTLKFIKWAASVNEEECNIQILWTRMCNPTCIRRFVKDHDNDNMNHHNVNTTMTIFYC